MKNWRAYFSVLLATSLFALVPPATVGEGAAPAQDVSETTRGAVEEAKVTLSKVDGELEFPMSEPEKTQSQGDLDKAKADLNQAGTRSASPEEILNLARQAGDLAHAAIDAARAGKRDLALKNFTAARIKLQEVRFLLAAQTTTTQPSSAADNVTLQGRVNKAQQTQAPDAAAPPPSPPPAQTYAPPPARDQWQTTYGQPGGRMLAQNEGSINVTPGSVTLGGSQGSRTGGNINIGPGGVSLRGNHPGGGSGSINITPGGINIGGRGQAPGGSGNIQITPGGVNIGGGGLESIINGALQQSGIVTGAGNGRTVYVSGNHENQTYAGEGRDFVVAGNHNNIVITGQCHSIVLSGNHNNVDAHTVAIINLLGNHNILGYVTGPGNQHPQITHAGSDNNLYKKAH